MDKKELFSKNQELSTEFEFYLLEHPELEEQIPDNSLIVFQPEYDPELSKTNLEIATRNREKNQPVVHVKVQRLLKSRIDGLELKVA
ncbi:MAG: DUF5647 family protein [Pseudomonadota bacterium]